MSVGTGIVIAAIVVAIAAMIGRRLLHERNDGLRSAQAFQDGFAAMANDIIAQLDSRLEQLEYLICEADEKLAQLDRRLLSQPTHMAQTVEEQAVQPVQLPGKQPCAAGCEDEELKELLLAAQGDEAPDRQHGTVVDSDKKQLILQMADQGNDVTAIAKTTGMGQGAVELLLQLYKK